LSYSIARKNGNGHETGFGFAGKILGTGVGLEAKFKADHFVDYTEEKGVFSGSKKYILEEYRDYGFQAPTRGRLLTFLDELQTGLAEKLKDVFLRTQGSCDGPMGLCVWRSFGSAELRFAEPADFEETAGMISFFFEGFDGPLASFYYAPMDTFGSANKPHYGVGGFHILYPTDQDLSQPAELVLDYYDEELIGFDEDSLRIYRLNTESRDWEYVGGVLDPVTNTVVTPVTRLGAYTLAPPMPAGRVAWADQQALNVGDLVQITLTSEPLLMNNGDPVAESTRYHILSILPFAHGPEGYIPFGVIVSEDADAELPGYQAAVENGTIQVMIEYPTEVWANAQIVVFSDIGTAFGDEVINLGAE
jgi:hypothetical protein